MNKQYFVEFFDIGGSSQYETSRDIFYSNCDALVLVYDVTNERSKDNLTNWIKEFIGLRIKEIPWHEKDEFPLKLDLRGYEKFASYIPVLFLANKCDLLTNGELHRKKFNQKNILFTSAQDISCFHDNSENFIMMNKFFEHVVNESQNKSKNYLFVQNNTRYLQNFFFFYIF